jgi:hypothetical protein
LLRCVAGLDGSHSTRMRYRVNTQSNLFLKLFADS